MDQDIGEAKHNDVWNFQEVDNGNQIVPNQSEFDLEFEFELFCFQTKLDLAWKILFGCKFSKLNWIWFGKGH